MKENSSKAIEQLIKLAKTIIIARLIYIGLSIILIRIFLGFYLTPEGLDVPDDQFRKTFRYIFSVIAMSMVVIGLCFACWGCTLIFIYKKYYLS